MLETPSLDTAEAHQSISILTPKTTGTSICHEGCQLETGLPSAKELSLEHYQGLKLISGHHSHVWWTKWGWKPHTLARRQVWILSKSQCSVSITAFVRMAPNCKVPCCSSGKAKQVHAQSVDSPGKPTERLVPFLSEAENPQKSPNPDPTKQCQVTAPRSAHKG